MDQRPSADRQAPRVSGDPMWLKAACIGLSFVFVGILVATPVAAIFQQALANGIGAYWQAISSDQSRQAIVLSLLAAFVAVPLNTTFGIAAAWAIARFEFPGKATFSAIIDLPFSVSPVIAGLVFVLLFGGRGLFGEWLQEHNFRIIFAAPGIVLATVFVTFPFVARELIPFMQAQGAEEDEAAMSLGASGLQTLLRVTLPSIKWSLLYGMIHCAARAMGEFGAVAVVSGHIRGRTVTAPLQVEILFNDFQFTAAFAVASLLAAMGLVTLLLKILLEGRRADHGN